MYSTLKTAAAVAARPATAYGGFAATPFEMTLAENVCEMAARQVADVVHVLQSIVELLEPPRKLRGVMSLFCSSGHTLLLQEPQSIQRDASRRRPPVRHPIRDVQRIVQSEIATLTSPWRDDVQSVTDANQRQLIASEGGRLIMQHDRSDGRKVDCINHSVVHGFPTISERRVPQIISNEFH